VHIIYFLLTVALFSFALALNGAWMYVFDPFALLIILFGTLFLQQISATSQERKALWNYLFTNNQPESPEAVEDSLTHMIRYIYAIGILLTLMGWMLLVNIFDLSDIETQRHMGDAFISTFYAGVINELFLRPMKNRLQ
jgi:flagellar motor component MotA